MTMRMKDFRKEPTLRSTRIVYLLTQGAKLTTREIARLTGMSYWGARSMMEVIESSHNVPVVLVDGCWQIIPAWDAVRREWFDPSKLSVDELHILIELTLKMMGKVEVTSIVK